jgi:hypothetical protein
VPISASGVALAGELGRGPRGTSTKVFMLPG